MLKRMKRNSIIQAGIFVVMAFGISIPIFPDSSMALKLFMFFTGIGCGVSLSGCLMVRRK